MFLFLLYVSVMLIITFLQQEFVFLPELLNFDLVGDVKKAQMIENWQNWRWLSFVVTPLQLLLRIVLVSLCLFVGSSFYTIFSNQKYKDWFEVATKVRKDSL